MKTSYHICMGIVYAFNSSRTVSSRALAIQAAHGPCRLVGRKSMYRLNYN